MASTQKKAGWKGGHIKVGVKLKKKDFTAIQGRINQGLIILERKQHIPTGIPELNLGLALSQRLLPYKNAVSPDIIQNELKNILNGAASKIYLSNPEVLFTAAYKIDVLATLLQAGRNRCLYLLWPGSIDGETLIYAQPDHEDYCKYEITNYIDTYVIVR